MIQRPLFGKADMSLAVLDFTKRFWSIPTNEYYIQLQENELLTLPLCNTLKYINQEEYF